MSQRSRYAESAYPQQGDDISDARASCAYILTQRNAIFANGRISILTRSTHFTSWLTCWK
jgi:hypothetical protein